MISDPSRTFTRVGVVGAGQLALMMGESASDLGLTTGLSLFGRRDEHYALGARGSASQA